MGVSCCSAFLLLIVDFCTVAASVAAMSSKGVFLLIVVVGISCCFTFLLLIAIEISLPAYLAASVACCYEQ